jgi:hypothetical protein
VRTTLKTVAHFHLPKAPLTIAPVKVLFIVALPELYQADMSAIDTIQQQLMEAVAQIQKKHASKLLIEFLYPASLAEMDNALRAQAYDMVHLSAFAPKDTPTLYLEDEKGDLSFVSTDDFGNLLRQYPTVKVLLINLLGIQPSNDIENRLSTYLPCVITTRFGYETDATSLFVTHFYDNLLQGKALIPALNDTRERLYFQLIYI